MENIKKLIVLIIFLSSLILMFGCVSEPQPKGREEMERPPEERGPRVTSEFQGWADENGDGFLQPEEAGRFIDSVHRFFEGPHDVENPVDNFLDGNKDGFIDHDDLGRAEMMLFERQLMNLSEINPELAELMDINNDRRIDHEEADLVRAYLFHDPDLHEPHDYRTPIDERIDRNRNGHVDEPELREFQMMVFDTVCFTMEVTPEMFDPERIRNEQAKELINVLDELADINMNGLLEPEEEMEMMASLSKPHEVRTELDKRLDFNQDGRIDEIEIMEARRMREAGIRHFEEGIDNYPVTTMIDDMLDLDKNGVVSNHELEAIMERIIVGGPVDPGNPIDITLDINKNNVVEDEDIVMLKDFYFRPHPVDPDSELDRELDKNKNRFIEPEEIGIAAGFSPVAELPPFEELYERIMWQREMEVKGIAAEEETVETPETTDTTETSDTVVTTTETIETVKITTNDIKQERTELQKKLDNVKGKSIAIININLNTEEVTEEEQKAILTFVENAFVNVGVVTVVDRKNISKVLEEQELQLSDIIDNETAVNIGKLAGADYIVIGNISYVGKKYYLQVKLIAVETAVVTGSGIEEAESENDFYELCNDVIYKLFR